ncbi:MAG: thermonuclease family protein [Candidatus Pacebacteria bacterium]|nr:thermonuclease family protein [Candidatus Paceibacterota bacterium]MDR3582827.1 thermonuclease family protein [Candidatus Paceibacterota bacterium]
MPGRNKKIKKPRSYWIQIAFVVAMAAILLLVIFFTFQKTPDSVPDTQPGVETKNNAPAENNQPTMEIAKVKYVIDGDTIELENGEKVRYIGIDAPETVDPKKPIQCFGPQASAADKKLVEGQTVRLLKDVSEKDMYGRLLRYAWVGNIFVNDYLVREGYARLDTFPPDTKYAAQFKADETEAKNNGRGLWGACR